MSAAIYLLKKEAVDLDEITNSLIGIAKELGDEKNTDVIYRPSGLDMNVVLIARPRPATFPEDDEWEQLDIFVQDKEAFFSGPTVLPYGEIELLKEYGLFLSIENRASFG